MLSKITTDSGKIYFIEPSTLSLYDENKRKVEFDVNEFKDCLKEDRHIDITRSDGKHFLRRCKIQLGLSCNYKCKYCVQEPFRVVEKQSGDIDRLVNTLYEKFDVENFQLWGGEPLVYWKTIKKLVPKIREKYTESSIVIISNGSLLDKEKVDFFVKYNVSFVMSHDGQAFKKYRNKNDPLDDKNFCDLWNYFCDQKARLNQQLPCFHAVITPENANFIDLHTYFLDRVNNPVVSIEGVCTLSKESYDKVTPFSTNHVSTLVETMYLMFNGLRDTEYCNTTFMRFIKGAIKSIMGMTVYDPNKARCANSENDILIVDLDGNILACQGARIKAEKKIFFIKENNQEKRDLFIFDRKNCANCTVSALCKGGCPILDDEQLGYYCINMKIWSIAVLCVALRVMTAEKIISIDTTATY